MEITLPNPTIRRDVPPIDEIEQNIGILCESAGFMLNRVKLTVAGSNHMREYRGVGIRVHKADRYNVLVFVGCKTNTVLAYLQIDNSEKRAISGQEVFNSLVRSCNPKRIFTISEQMIRDYGLRHRAANGSHSPVPPPRTVVTVREPEPLAIPSVEPQVAARVEEPVEKKTDSPRTYVVHSHHPGTNGTPHLYVNGGDGHHFDDPHNLHLTATALVSGANSDPEFIFGFKTFEAALVESGVPSTAGKPSVIVRMFLIREFMVRVNPNGDPPRYTITRKLIDFVEAPVPTHAEAIAKGLLRRGTSPKKASPPSAPLDIKTSITRLKEMELRHMQVSERKRAVEATIAQLQGMKLDDTERELQAQLSLLDKRLAEVKENLGQIEGSRKLLAAAEKEKTSLERELVDPKLIHALAELREFRSLLG